MGLVEGIGLFVAGCCVLLHVPRTCSPEFARYTKGPEARVATSTFDPATAIPWKVAKVEKTKTVLPLLSAVVAEINAFELSPVNEAAVAEWTMKVCDMPVLTVKMTTRWPAASGWIRAPVG